MFENGPKNGPWYTFPKIDLHNNDLISGTYFILICEEDFTECTYADHQVGVEPPRCVPRRRRCSGRHVEAARHAPRQCGSGAVHLPAEGLR